MLHKSDVQYVRWVLRWCEN